MILYWYSFRVCFLTFDPQPEREPKGSGLSAGDANDDSCKDTEVKRRD